MPPRNPRRQRMQEEYTEESDDNTYKRRKIDKKQESNEKDSFEETEDYLKAVDVLKKRKENGLLLIQTELNMRMENAKSLAVFEEQRIQQFYEEQVAEVKRRIKEDTMIQTRKMAAEASKHLGLLPSVNHTTVESLPKSSQSMVQLVVEDQCCFTTCLTEEEMIDDLFQMVRSTKEVCAKSNVEMPCVVIPLSNSRLLLNDHVIYPNTPCTLLNGNTRMTDCVFVATSVKERELKEKKKDPEFIVRVSATRKKRFPIESLRDGSIQVLFKDEDCQLNSVEETVESSS